MSNFILQDSAKVRWLVGVDDIGTITRTVVPEGPPSLIVLQGPSDQAFQLVVSTGGVVSGSPLTNPAIQGATHALLVSPSGAYQYQLKVDIVGAVFTVLDPSWSAGFPVGTLYPTPYYPTFSQPGGAGTPTFPQQTIGEKLGMWTAGCGHWFNNWFVPNSAYLGIPSAYICCPYCGYIQQIVTPQALIYTDAYYIIIA